MRPSRRSPSRSRTGAGDPTSRNETRCAIYTRVSTDHGLEQEFNSLDAQREACAAYVKSQIGEGWIEIRDPYNDGGFSGGSMDRPALTRLLADIEARKIDTVVVYKVDRLTRSLADFAKLIELFEAHQVSFVSVTQSFNTTTSMGRLTLNVLLSFAQFEREVAGERIRDKVAASKKKGIWVGGTLPLGYRVDNRKLVIDEAEAATVRLIFRRYLDLGAMTPLLADLHSRGILTRTRTLATGRTIGGIPIGRGALGHLLKNRIYIGELNHKERSYPGEHPPILEKDLFDAVQRKLIKNRAVEQHRQASSEALLLGKIFDDRGFRMTPTAAVKNGARYRYYISRALTEGRKDEAGSVPRVSAPDVEAVVLGAIRNLRARLDEGDETLAAGDRPGGTTASALSGSPRYAHGHQPRQLAPEPDDRSIVAEIVERVVVTSNAIEIRLIVDMATTPEARSISVPWSKPTNTRRREVLGGSGTESVDPRPMRADARNKLLEAITNAKEWRDELISGGVKDIPALAAREHRSRRSVRMTLSLAFLSPTIVAAAVEGRLPRDVGMSRLADMSADWCKQGSSPVLSRLAV